MNEPIRRRYYLSAEEFAVCCGAAGLDRLCGFPAASGRGRRAEVGEILFAMQRDGLLAAGEDTFTLCPELSVFARRIAGGKTAALVLRERYDFPCGLLYGGADGYVSLERGVRPEEYAGLAGYERGELAAWLADTGLAPPVTQTAPETLPEEDDEETGALQALLRSVPWPPDDTRAGGALTDRLCGCLDFRTTTGLEPLGRIYLLQGTLSLWIAEEDGDGLVWEKYAPETLVRKIQDRMEGTGE